MVSTGYDTLLNNSSVGTDYTKTVAGKTEKNANEKAKANANDNAKANANEKAAVYEKSEATTKKELYSINKMSQEDRTKLVNQLKTEVETRRKNLIDMVNTMFSKQNKAYHEANYVLLTNMKSNTVETSFFSYDDDSVWSKFADGKVTVDEAARKQAEEDISEDGYWGVKQTSQRLFDFASALAGDDVDKMKLMQSAMKDGYDSAAKAWGKEMPDLCKDTLAAANKLFEDYYASKNTSDTESATETAKNSFLAQAATNSIQE